MSISPVIYLIKEQSLSSTRDVLSKQQNKTIEDLQAILTKFSITLSKKANSIKFDVINRVDKNTVLKENEIVRIADIKASSVENGNQLQSPLVHILVNNLSNKPQFIVSPSAGIDDYLLQEENKEAELNTKSLKAIVLSLFEVLQCNVAVSGTDSSPGPTSLQSVFNEPLYYSNYSIISKDQSTATALKTKLEGIAHSVIDHGTHIEISVTDQPFCLSSYNSDDSLESSPVAEYQAVINKVIHDLPGTE